MSNTNIKCRLHVKFINRLHIMVNFLPEGGIQVIFIWVSSHKGLLGNDVADMKTKEACEKEIPDYDFVLSKEQCKSRIFKFLKERSEREYNDLDFLFEGAAYYNK